jgi:hypothetical protein
MIVAKMGSGSNSTLVGSLGLRRRTHWHFQVDRDLDWAYEEAAETSVASMMVVVVGLAVDGERRLPWVWVEEVAPSPCAVLDLRKVVDWLHAQVGVGDPSG